VESERRSEDEWETVSCRERKWEGRGRKNEERRAKKIPDLGRQRVKQLCPW